MFAKKKRFKQSWRTTQEQSQRSTISPNVSGTGTQRWPSGEHCVTPKKHCRRAASRCTSVSVTPIASGAPSLGALHGGGPSAESPTDL